MRELTSDDCVVEVETKWVREYVGQLAREMGAVEASS